MEIRYTNWTDITLSMADSIQKVANDETLSTAEKDIAIVAMMCEVPEEEVWKLSVDEVNRLRTSVMWVGMPTKHTNNIPKVIRLGDMELMPDFNVGKWSYAQYVDFQTYIKQQPLDKASLLSTILIPKGKKYNDGYDVADVIKAIYNHMTIQTADDICFFFTLRLTSSIDSLLSSLSRKRTVTEKERKMLSQIRTMAAHMLG